MKTYINTNKPDTTISTHQEGDRWLTNFVPYLIYRITGHLNRRLRRKLRRSSINISRWRVLAVLKDHGLMNMSQIVEKTIIEQPTVSRIVDQLESEGLATRVPGVDDSRFVQVQLTPAGEAAFNQVYPIALSHEKQALKGFTEQEIRTLTGFLERIHRNISPPDQ
jgi:DNA-binding MarR family transcriptional regulator